MIEQCPDCGAAYQETADGWRCPWATPTSQRIEHEDPPEPPEFPTAFRIVACGRQRSVATREAVARRC